MLSGIYNWLLPVRIGRPRATGEPGGLGDDTAIMVMDTSEAAQPPNASARTELTGSNDQGSANSDEMSDSVALAESNYLRGGQGEGTIQIFEAVTAEFQGPDGVWDALGYIDHFASVSGFSASVKRSNSSEGRHSQSVIRRMRVVCLHSGIYKLHVMETDKAIKKRLNQFTLKRECPFSVEIYNKSLGPSRFHTIGDKSSRKLSDIYCIDVIDGSHNHGVVDFSVIPKYRQRDLILKHESLIMTELNNGTPIMEIIKRMRDADEMKGDPVKTVIKYKLPYKYYEH